MRYTDKKKVDEGRNLAKECAEQALLHQHPTDKAVSYREIETWAGDKAAAQEETNERDGVPERGQDG